MMNKSKSSTLLNGSKYDGVNVSDNSISVSDDEQPQAKELESAPAPAPAPAPAASAEPERKKFKIRKIKLHGKINPGNNNVKDDKPLTESF